MSDITIKEWASEDRPREKMLLKGVGALSDAELLAILIGSGNKEENAVELSRRILLAYQNNINILGKQGIKELLKFKGIGEAKAITVMAALELGKRRKFEIGKREKLTNSQKIYEYFYSSLIDLPYEEFWILLLNGSLEIIHKVKIGQGGLAETSADIRLIFNAAISHLASAIVMCHNHPSGSLRPSIQDDRLTEQVRKASQIFGITLLDHLIIGGEKYYSYCDEGKI